MGFLREIRNVVLEEQRCTLETLHSLDTGWHSTVHDGLLSILIEFIGAILDFVTEELDRLKSQPSLTVVEKDVMLLTPLEETFELGNKIGLIVAQYEYVVEDDNRPL